MRNPKAKWAVVVWLDELPNLSRLTPVVSGYFVSGAKADKEALRIHRMGYEVQVRSAAQARRLKYQSSMAYDKERKRLQKAALSGCSCARR